MAFRLYDVILVIVSTDCIDYPFLTWRVLKKWVEAKPGTPCTEVVK